MFLTSYVSSCKPSKVFLRWEIWTQHRREESKSQKKCCPGFHDTLKTRVCSISCAISVEDWWRVVSDRVRMERTRGWWIETPLKVGSIGNLTYSTSTQSVRAKMSIYSELWTCSSGPIWQMEERPNLRDSCWLARLWVYNLQSLEVKIGRIVNKFWRA